VDLVAAVVADEQSFVVVEPGECALDRRPPLPGVMTPSIHSAVASLAARETASPKMQ
jgi:hypothetical protein